MQNLELAGVFAIVGIAAFLLRARFVGLNEAPLPWRLAVGFGVGGLISLFMLVTGTDVLLDELEPMALPVLATAVVALSVLAFRQLR